jgi:NodT family efflux transporter outer membrane factor (OMF) lipoprotein
MDKIQQSLILSLCLLATSCTTAVRDFNPPVTPADSFSEKGLLPMSEKWWEVFNDPQLDALIEYGLSHNFTLLTAYDRLTQANAIAKKIGAEWFPQLYGSLGTNNNFSKTSSSINRFSVGFTASYELDLWGRIRSGMNAAQLDVQATQEDIHIAAISLSAEITRLWYQLINQRLQLKLLNQQIKVNENNVSIIITRFNQGQARAADVFQQKNILHARLGDKASVVAVIKRIEYQLLTLQGKPANQATNILQPNNFPILDDLPATGLSSELIQRRPDIRRAYLAIQSADQRIAAAIADRFPKISLSGSFNSHTPDLQSFFNNWLATLAGNLVLPLLDGHRRVAEVERQHAIFSEKVNRYGAVILTAIQEVETALINEKQQRIIVDNLDKQLDLSRLANDQIQLRYRYGGMDYLRVLSAQLDLQSFERKRINAEQQLIQYRIDLYKALAGSWVNAFPVPHQPALLRKEKT